MKRERLKSTKPTNIVNEAQEHFNALWVPKHFSNRITPMEKYLSDIVHPFHLGVPPDFSISAGNDFIMHSPFTEYGSDIDLATLFRRYSHRSERIGKYLEYSRILSRFVKDFGVSTSDYIL